MTVVPGRVGNSGRQKGKRSDGVPEEADAESNTCGGVELPMLRNSVGSR